MRLRRRVRHLFPRTIPRFLLLLLLLALYRILARRPPPKSVTLPIHEFTLSPSRHAHTTDVVTAVSTTASHVLPLVERLPSHAIVLLTAGCVRHTPNLRETLYLALLLHNATAVVPRLVAHRAERLSALLPIITHAYVLQGKNSLQAALRALRPSDVLETALPARSACTLLPGAYPRSAVTRGSSRRLVSTLYGTGDELAAAPDLRPLPYLPGLTVDTVLFVAPWLQMGGSEQSLLLLARYFKQRAYRVAFMVTQPFWGEVGDILVTKNDWLGRAYEVTDFVCDLVNTAPYHNRARLLRYYLDTLRPSFVITANSRLFYHLLPLTRTLLADVVIADYNHMVHTDWRGGGMPRFGANSTMFIDRHFGASHNVTTAIRGWIAGDGFRADKARTCYIGADVQRLENPLVRWWRRLWTRARLAVGREKILVLFAGRFVLDKGIDVLADVIMKLRDDDRFAFLLVGTGADSIIQPLSRLGSVVVKPRASPEEMSDYYAAADIFLLPSAKEGIALVLYEAMANGLLVISTDVGGQKEVITRERGVLLERGTTAELSKRVLQTLDDVVRRRRRYDNIRYTGMRVVRQRYTTERFCECVYGSLQSAWKERTRRANALTEEIVNGVRETLQEDRFHSVWSWRVYPQSVEGVLTIAVSGGCDDKIGVTMESLRGYDGVSVTRGRTLEELLQGVDTELVMILPSGYFLQNTTDLQKLVDLVRRPRGEVLFDMLGVRVEGGAVGRLSKSGGETVYCSVGEELLRGSGDVVLRSLDAANVVEVGVEVLKMDVLNGVFVARAARLRQARDAGAAVDGLPLWAWERAWRVGYVDSVAVGSRCSGLGAVGVRHVGKCDVNREALRYKS